MFLFFALGFPKGLDKHFRHPNRIYPSLRILGLVVHIVKAV